MKIRPSAKKQRGQILIMTTFAAIPMFAIIGLVTDIGYMQYVKKSTQNAADAAAFAAAVALHSQMTGSSYTCGGVVVCQSKPTFCDPTVTTPSTPIDNGCLYAK